MNSTVLKAIAIILFGIAAFDIMGVIVRLLGNNYPILQISVLRNLFGIIPSIVILMLGPGISDLKKINTVYISEKEKPMSINEIKVMLKKQNLFEKPIDSMIMRYWPGDKEQKS